MNNIIKSWSCSWRDMIMIAIFAGMSFLITSCRSNVDVSPAEAINVNVLAVLHDFEHGSENFSVYYGPSKDVAQARIEKSNDAKIGTQSAKFFFPKNNAGSWNNLLCKIVSWPKGGDIVSFWAKAPKQCKAEFMVVEKNLGE